MEEILDHLGFFKEYNTETLMDMLEELCFEDPEIADRLQEHIDEITYLTERRLQADTDCLLAEIEYGDGSGGSLAELVEVLLEKMHD